MDSKNVIAAIALSSAVIVLYSLFFVPEQTAINKNAAEKKRLSKVLIHQVWNKKKLQLRFRERKH